MATLGEELRAAREGKGLSLKQIAEKTRISQTFLKALEDGEYSVIPGEVFVAGFLRSYAKELGLPGDEILRKYKGLRQPPQPQQPPQPPQQQEQKPQPQAQQPKKRKREHEPKPAVISIPHPGEGKGRRFTLVVLGGLLLGVVLTGATLLLTAREEAPPPPPPPVAAPQPQPFVPATTAFDNATGMKNATSVAPGFGKVTSAKAPDAAKVAAAKEEKKAEKEAKKEEKKAEPLILRLTARDTSWYSFKADRREREHGLLNRGETITVKADDRIVLDIGNGGGVRAEYNGKRLKALGGTDQPVKNIVFTKAGMTPGRRIETRAIRVEPLKNDTATP